jgi:hypothetical protein
MKYKIFASLLIITGSLGFLSFSIKPFAYTLRAIDPATGKIRTTLEKSNAVLQKGKGKNTTASVYNISGSKSLTRLKISEAVFQSDSDKSTLTMNPADYIILYKLTTDKNNRSFSGSESLISTSFTSLDYGMYRVAPSSGLVPGEYAFIDKSTTTAEGNFTVWTFGVD